MFKIEMLDKLLNLILYRSQLSANNMAQKLFYGLLVFGLAGFGILYYCTYYYNRSSRSFVEIYSENGNALYYRETSIYNKSNQAVGSMVRTKIYNWIYICTQ